ncbi:uncharacterized protein HD556DRAFT_1312340 [Suillus plorans]|uniref:Uncharacterized protein n=1 Tax=Suillus plorans TaxID=116603 RepID=A0A9P7AGW8_9AGAM|nr:uncharacterized protein HD556DRAFT_1312340 [Suillus plorans]KAG1788069.1 hypothetical protein HD556DRAFT_1312340 [Suillus plorans]
MQSTVTGTIPQKGEFETQKDNHAEILHACRHHLQPVTIVKFELEMHTWIHKTPTAHHERRCRYARAGNAGIPLMSGAAAANRHSAMLSAHAYFTRGRTADPRASTPGAPLDLSTSLISSRDPVAIVSSSVDSLARRNAIALTNERSTSDVARSNAKPMSRTTQNSSGHSGMYTFGYPHGLQHEMIINNAYAGETCECRKPIVRSSCAQSAVLLNVTVKEQRKVSPLREISTFRPAHPLLMLNFNFTLMGKSNATISFTMGMGPGFD